ncbi:UNVERIFIED_CONTAM: hypothetical protein GTU68_027732 [Idotea baltica]|nr:hypothetical protein [Idotea baltica]
MIAARMFLDELQNGAHFDRTERVSVELFGSLALTGLGHGTDSAVIMGLEGEHPRTVEPSTVGDRLSAIRSDNQINLNAQRQIEFLEADDLLFNRNVFLEGHPNALTFAAFSSRQVSQPLLTSTYYSIGGGFVVKEGEVASEAEASSAGVPFPFSSAKELLQLTAAHQMPISELARRNELTFRSEQELNGGLDEIWEAMKLCVERGCHNSGILPGGLKIERRAPGLFQALKDQLAGLADLGSHDWVDLYALAVNEENAAGGRVVTAPTNGAAGIIPAVLHYYTRHCPGATEAKVHTFLLTAGMIGSLYKRNASISGAEVGCQGEVGVACSMAAGALTEVLGGTPEQVEEAAEIGMEHNLGLTCDPIRGLVQVPCIERNAMGAVKAINASRLALRGDGKHFVSLDRVIRVMKRTGADMSARYKETSRGGLAVNLSEC